MDLYCVCNLYVHCEMVWWSDFVLLKATGIDGGF